MDYINKGQFPPEKGRSITPQPNYNSNSNKPGLSPPRYTSQSRSVSPQPVGPNGTLVLVDRDDGFQVGALDGNLNTQGVIPGNHDPVEIDLTRPDGVVTVRTISADYLRDSQHPAYASSRLVGTAATASRTLVAGASMLAKAMESGARSFTERTQPAVTPMTFAPTTHNRVRQVHNYTSTGAKISSDTVGKISNYTQNFGAKLAGKSDDRADKGTADKPGILNKSVIAFSTLADSIDHATRLILTSGSQAATTVVAHKYGAEAGELARGLTGAVKNVGLVYIDAAGVSRRAVVKSVAKGMVVGKVRGGGEVVFEGDNASQGALLPNAGPQGHGGMYNPPPGGQMYNPPPHQQGQHVWSPQPQYPGQDMGGVHRAQTFPTQLHHTDTGLSGYSGYTGHSQSGRNTPVMPQGHGHGGLGDEKKGGNGGQFRY